jgi:dephospho-CoA kinase
MNENVKAYVVGLTGGIGSGKTVASDRFKALGVPIIDTDVIAREVVKPGSPALTQLVDAFGNLILQKDGSLDRSVLREIAFS